MTSSPADAALARDLAQEVGRRLLQVRADARLDGRELRDAGDRAAQEVIAARLDRDRPGDAVLSEEAPDPVARTRARRVWIVDPLDGTREFGERGRPDWAVHIALWQDGVLAAGAVSLPALGLTFGTDVPPALPAPGVRPVVGLPGDAAVGAPSRAAASAVRPFGAQLSGPGRTSSGPGGVPSGTGGRSFGTDGTMPSVPAGSAPVRIVVSRGRPPGFTPALAQALGAVLVPMGSAGAKTAAVWLGVADAYVHAGGQHEWDSAAPVAVALAAGLHASRLDGAPLEYNRADPWLPDLLVCRPELADPILSWTAHHFTEVTPR